MLVIICAKAKTISVGATINFRAMFMTHLSQHPTARGPQVLGILGEGTTYPADATWGKTKIATKLNKTIKHTICFRLKIWDVNLPMGSKMNTRALLFKIFNYYTINKKTTIKSIIHNFTQLNKILWILILRSKII